VHSEQLNSIARAFLTEMQACVRANDFQRARALFDDDVIAFGTYAAVLSGREHLETEQWRKVWPNIREFTFRLDEARSLRNADAICIVVPWDSVGTRPDGSAFQRPGRATLLLTERDGRWVAVHSHFSLAPSPMHSGRVQS
jgi:ketosteroid isomerase-like protein